MKRQFYQTLSLRTSLANLKDPSGTIICGMRPITLNNALQFIIQEENIDHFKCEALRAHPSINAPTEFSNFDQNSNNFNNRHPLYQKIPNFIQLTIF